jgi:1,4-dihydroxy-2-naphthoate octaprenyltransferase
MTGGAYLALGGVGTPFAWLITLIPMALISNLLLLNQFPDIDADKKMGRRHFPILYGTLWSSALYGLLSLGAAWILLFTLLEYQIPWLAAMACLPLCLTPVVTLGAYRYGRQIERLLPFMGINVAISLMTPTLLALGIFLGQ